LAAISAAVVVVLVAATATVANAHARFSGSRIATDFAPGPSAPFFLFVVA
jgi:hypothetical protein